MFLYYCAVDDQIPFTKTFKNELTIFSNAILFNCLSATMKHSLLITFVNRLDPDEAQQKL